ncbi:hypothetical protein M2118_000579 [Aurantimicrobium minutum]|uniref:hypothetical protein n=1 Tax=Aurantimicrobium minutum TaxID=708131 RepID=UPI002476791A|nr:hypothetical protein [Aurantimicrobium minutum]MDH6277616.1 hypothetical protein [Aurantimicrobium minutum]
MTKRFVALFAILGLVTGLSACSTGPSYPKEVVEGYFSAINENDPAAVLAAQEFAAQGSNADAYVIEQSAHKQAQLDGGSLDQTKTVTVFEQDKVLLCVEGYDEPEVKKDDFCATYTDLIFKDGKLSDFSAGGKSLNGRLALGSGELTPIGEIGTARYISSYITIAGDLVIVVEITSTAGDLSLPWDATYLGTNGRQVSVSFTDGPGELAAGRVGNVAYNFIGASFGGALELKFYDADYNEIPISIQTQK